MRVVRPDRARVDGVTMPLSRALCALARCCADCRRNHVGMSRSAGHTPAPVTASGTGCAAPWADMRASLLAASAVAILHVNDATSALPAGFRQCGQLRAGHSGEQPRGFALGGHSLPPATHQQAAPRSRCSAACCRHSALSSRLSMAWWRGAAAADGILSTERARATGTATVF